MSIRLIARDLYRVKKEVEALEKSLLTAPEEEKPTISIRLKAAIAERDKLQAMLDGAKEPPKLRLPR